MRALTITVVSMGLVTAWAAAPVMAAPGAAPPRSLQLEPIDDTSGVDEVDYVVVDPSPRARRSTGLARVVYLNRCVGGCAVERGDNDPTRNRSEIVRRNGTLSEFAYGDVAWDSLFACVKRAYSLYDVEVTTTEPPPGTSYVEVMVAGHPTELGMSPGMLGIAPLSSDCTPQRDVIAFAFADAHRYSGINELCATAVHEAGHTFGLDHALQCRDPMTYLTACGERAFLNLDSKCGEFRLTRNCRCADTQNSHVKLLNELGPSGRPAPAGEVVFSHLERWDGSLLTGIVFEPRWIRSIELWINGFRWARLPHSTVVEFYFPAPPVSDGVLDVEIRAVNDLGAVASNSFTVIKGAPCQSSASCGANEQCQQGRCQFQAPTGQLGQACAEDSECASWECFGYGGQRRCSAVCTPGLRDGDCPADYTCVSNAYPDPGKCWPTDELPSGGCAGSAPAPGVLMLVSLWGLAWRRRRRPAAVGRGGRDS